VTPPSDFSVIKNFSRKTHCRKSHAEQDVKQLYRFYYQMKFNMTSKFTRIEFSGSLCLGKYSTSITRIVQNRTYRWTQGNAANDSL